MSQATVLKFIESDKVDNSLRSQLEAATNSAQLKEIAVQKGYDFTEQEMLTVLQKQGILTITEDEDLSEKELETVAGGKPKFKVGISFGIEF